MKALGHPSGTKDAPSSLGPNSFIFMQFSANVKILCNTVIDISVF